MKRVRRDQNPVSRRDFIKGAAVGAGAASLPAFGAQTDKAKVGPRSGTLKRMSSSSGREPRACPQQFKRPRGARP